MDKKYKEYLKSKAWANIKSELYNSRGKKCERCASKLFLQVHHKTYKNIFNEKPEDLEILCDACHKKEHGIVVRRGVKHLPPKPERPTSYIPLRKRRKKKSNKNNFIKLMPDKKWKSEEERHEKWLKIMLRMCIDEREKALLTENKMIPFGLKRRLRMTNNSEMARFEGYS